MKCLICHIGNANIHSIYGVLPCDFCVKKQDRLLKPSTQIEFTTESIKQQRQEHREDILPMHNRGELDKGWVERFGEKKAKQRGFSDAEIRNARYVWDGVDEYYHSH